MSLTEVRSNILQQRPDGTVHRFYQDGRNRTSLSVWTAADSGAIRRFQYSFRDTIFEWRGNGRVLCGRVDEGDNPLGMKRSPVFRLQPRVDQRPYENAVQYLSTGHKDEILLDVIRILTDESSRPEIGEPE